MVLPVGDRPSQAPVRRPVKDHHATTELSPATALDGDSQVTDVAAETLYVGYQTGPTRWATEWKALHNGHELS
jgi:hypothetical protein